MNLQTTQRMLPRLQQSVAGGGWGWGVDERERESLKIFSFQIDFHFPASLMRKPLKIWISKEVQK